MTQAYKKARLAVDIGGTFTDVVAQKPDGTLVTHKLLSENPARYADAAGESLTFVCGPGEFMGARQSGDALLRFADLALDGALIEAARKAAQRLLAEQPLAAAAQVERWLASRIDYARA